MLTQFVDSTIQFWVVIWPLAAGLLGGVVGAICIEVTKRRIWRPTIRLMRDLSRMDIAADAKCVDTYRKSHYLRFVVRNNGRATATKCRAYLSAFSKGDIETKFVDTLRLREAYEDLDGAQGTGVDVPVGVPQTFDLLSCMEGEMRVLEFARKVAMERPDYQEMLKFEGVGRFSVIVACDQIPPLSIWIDVEFGRNDTDFKIIAFGEGERRRRVGTA